MTHNDQALAYLESAEAATAGLREIYASRMSIDKREVASFYDDVRQGAKLAEVHALLYIGDQLAAVVRELADAPGSIAGIAGRPLAPEALDYEHSRINGVNKIVLHAAANGLTPDEVAEQLAAFQRVQS